MTKWRKWFRLHWIFLVHIKCFLIGKCAGFWRGCSGLEKNLEPLDKTSKQGGKTKVFCFAAHRAIKRGQFFFFFVWVFQTCKHETGKKAKPEPAKVELPAKEESKSIGDGETKATSWPNTQVWAQKVYFVLECRFLSNNKDFRQKASSWTNSIWNAIQPKQEQPKLIDISSSSVPNLPPPKAPLSSLPMDLFEPKSSERPAELLMFDEDIKSEEIIKVCFVFLVWSWGRFFFYKGSIRLLSRKSLLSRICWCLRWTKILQRNNLQESSRMTCFNSKCN